MADYSTTVVVNAPAANAPYAVIRSATAAAGQGSRPKLKKLVVTADTAVQGEVALYRAQAANYGTQNATQAGQPIGSANDPPAGTTVDTSWSSPPTLPSGAAPYNGVPIDGCSLAGVIGNGFVFSWPNGLALDPNTAIIIWNPVAAGGPKLRVTPTWEE